LLTFFFQAEDGIRDRNVTGVQTCALPISPVPITSAGGSPALASSLAEATVAAERRGKTHVGSAHLVDYLDGLEAGRINGRARPQIGRAACRERVEMTEGGKGVEKENREIA